MPDTSLLLKQGFLTKKIRGDRFDPEILFSFILFISHQSRDPKISNFWVASVTAFVLPGTKVVMLTKAHVDLSSSNDEAAIPEL